MFILPVTPTTQVKSINSKNFNAGLCFSSLTDNINTYTFGDMLQRLNWRSVEDSRKSRKNGRFVMHITWQTKI
jgi:hypothetical protein